MDDSFASFLSNHQSTLNQSIVLPAMITDQYELYDCLHFTDFKSTYLVRDKADKSFAVLKIAEKTTRSDLMAEYQILETLHSPTFPKALSFLSDEHMNYLIRSYIAGYPVSHYVEKYGPFSESEAMRLIIGLCQPLQLMHTQTPPIIHRDIKPLNVIFTPERRLALIDFDTVRHYQANQSKDTAFLGTEMTAAPEQFGYKQTDQRSDIYSTGVLLLFLCTGSYELDCCASIHNRSLARVIEICTSFDPDRRYANIHQLQIRLERALTYETRSAHSFLLGTALGLIAGCGLTVALLVARVIPLAANTSPATSSVKAALAASPEDPNLIAFDSPQIEQAIREQLGYSADKPLYQADLDRISELFIFGNETMSSWYDLTYDVLYHPDYPNGNILSLKDIPKLRNLTSLAICNQQIVDLTPLQGMSIIRLALNGNRIMNLSAIAEMPYLIELYIGNNPIVRISALSNCTFLRVLDLSSTNVVDLSPISELNLEHVFIRSTPIASYEPLFHLSSLAELSVSDISKSDLELVSNLSQLTQLHYSGTLPDVTPLFRLRNLTSLLLIDNALTSLEGIESLSQLQNLYLSGAPNL
ncbi:MAG: protein kinase, partial [Petrimonas sp.]|nr:protein kinase [Petrimonas sp.]